MQVNLSIDLAEYKKISTYIPRAGDFIIWHGWFSKYYGIISGCDENKVKIITAGIPYLLFTMSQDDMEKSIKVVSLSAIRSSRGSYAIQQNNVWYV